MPERRTRGPTPFTAGSLASTPIDFDSLLDVHDDDNDVVIRPIPTSRAGATYWPLSRPAGTTTAMKMRLEPSGTPPNHQVHVGHDWLFVLDGRIRLTLGEREIVIGAGEAAEFSTMTPHAIDAIDALAELVTVIDRDGQRARLHTHNT